MIAPWLRWRASVAIRSLAHAIDDAYIGLNELRRPLIKALWSASAAVDPDTLPCPCCSEAGGAHLDCELPGLGRMTATERRQAFPEEASP